MNRFGTPETLSKRGKFLAKGVRGKNAPEAARRWIQRNRALFRLSSTAGLELVGDSPMAFSRGHAVNFRQVSQGLQTVEGGLITVGMTGSAKKGWNIAQRDVVADAERRAQRPREAVGRSGLAAGSGLRRESTATRLRMSARRRRPAAGLTWRSAVSATSRRSGPSHSRPSVPALAPAFETIVLKAKDAVGYKIVIDARNGKVLSRLNLVHNFAEGNKSKAAGEAYTFDGELAATDGACSSEGPFAIGAGNRALDGFGAATVPAERPRAPAVEGRRAARFSRHAVLAGAVPL